MTKGSIHRITTFCSFHHVQERRRSLTIMVCIIFLSNVLNHVRFWTHCVSVFTTMFFMMKISSVSLITTNHILEIFISSCWVRYTQPYIWNHYHYPHCEVCMLNICCLLLCGCVFSMLLEQAQRIGTTANINIVRCMSKNWQLKDVDMFGS